MHYAFASLRTKLHVMRLPLLLLSRPHQLYCVLSVSLFSKEGPIVLAARFFFCFWFQNYVKSCSIKQTNNKKFCGKPHPLNLIKYLVLFNMFVKLFKYKINISRYLLGKNCKHARTQDEHSQGKQHKALFLGTCAIVVFDCFYLLSNRYFHLVWLTQSDYLGKLPFSLSF